MSFFGNHVNLTPASQSDWNKNNSKDAAHIKNRPFFVDDNGEIHKLDKDFLPDEVALKEDIRVTSVNGMTGDVVIEAGGGDSVIISDGIYVQENEPVGAEDGALWVDLDEEITVEQPGVGQFGFGENAEVFNGIDPVNASGDYSHAEGRDTIAAGVNSHVQGAYNLKDNGNRYAHIVGNGKHGNRSNAHTLDWNGNAWFQGDVFVGGTSQDDADRLVRLSEIGGGGSSLQSDWNENDEDSLSYINNRTHYVEYEGPVSYTSQIGEFTIYSFSNKLTLQEGATYTVTVNNSEYKLIGQYFDDWDQVFLGDRYYLNGTHNGSNVPFAIVSSSNGQLDLYAPYGVYGISLVEDASGSVINERGWICWNHYFDGHELTVGNTYRVIFDNIEYDFTATENAEGFVIIGDATQDPFEIETNVSDNRLELRSFETGVHTISLIDITNNELIIDNKCVGKIQYSHVPASPLKENQKYEVRLDDNVYYCKAKREPYSNIIYIGNLANFICYLSNEDIDVSNFDFQDTKEPFFITYSDEDISVFYSGDSINELSIETIESNIQTLDPKFLPASVTHATIRQPICDETIFVELGSGGDYLDISEPLEIGQFYEIQVDDKVYYAKCQELDGIVILGSILTTLMVALGSEIPPAELEMIMSLLETMLSFYGTALDLYKEIPFGIMYQGGRAGFVSSYPGMHKIKISPVLEIFPISKTLLPKTSLPKRTVYETIDILADAESNKVQASDGTTLYATKLSNSNFCRTIPEAIRAGGEERLMLLSGVHIYVMLSDTVIGDMPLTTALVETENAKIAIIDVAKGLRSIQDMPVSKYEQVFMCVEEESSVPDIDFTFTPGLWFISTSADLISTDADLPISFMVKLVFATSNDIADIDIIPERIARVEDISIQYDTLKPCGEEKVYVEWSKEKVYPESSLNTERVLLSNENFYPKQLYGKHYLIKRETENGIAVIDKIITPLDIASDIVSYDIDEIQFFNPDFFGTSGISSILITQLSGGAMGITFPKEPEDESLIYFKIYEPMKQLDDSLLSNNIVRKEDLPCYDETVYYEWNEDTEYETSVELPTNDTISKYVKISNDAPDSNFFLGKQYSARGFFSDNEADFDATISEQHLTPISDGAYAVVETTLVVTTDSVVFNGVTLTKGIWSASEYLDASFKYYWWKIYDPAKTIEEKYLPDTVVKSSDLQGKILINPESASVGQLMMVEEIDENGAPTKWRAVDASSLMEVILPAVSAEDEGKTLTVVDGKWQLA